MVIKLSESRKLLMENSLQKGFDLIRKSYTFKSEKSTYGNWKGQTFFTDARKSH